MYETIEELLQKIKLGEDTTIEFKSVRFKGKKIDLSREDTANEIAAFANTSDGVILLGIDDKTKTVDGIPIERIDDLEGFIREIINDAIKPPVFARIVKLFLPDNTGKSQPILKIDIPKSLFVHKSPGGYFKRLGSSKRELESEALARLFQQRSQTRIIRFDEQPVPDTNLADLKEGLWKRFSYISNEPEETILEKLRILTYDDSNNLKASVSGILLCSESPEKYFPNAFIEAVSYRGVQRDSNNQIDAKSIYGPLDYQIRDSIKFVKSNMKISATKAPGRIDKPQFSLRAVFEAIVNAVAHRDYSIYSSKIRLFLFDDRMEIYSPGTIPNSMTIESLPLRQSTRNELITSFLSRCQIDFDKESIKRQYLMEKRGEGVPIIFSESEKLSGKKPVYQMIDESELQLIIYS